VAGNPTTTTATFLFSISRPNALKKENNGFQMYTTCIQYIACKEVRLPSQSEDGRTEAQQGVDSSAWVTHAVYLTTHFMRALAQAT